MISLRSLIVPYNDNFGRTPSPALVPRPTGTLSPKGERGGVLNRTPSSSPTVRGRGSSIEPLPSVAAATEGGERSEPGEGVPQEAGFQELRGTQPWPYDWNVHENKVT
jgi:hypothetical protein